MAPVDIAAVDNNSRIGFHIAHVPIPQRDGESVDSFDDPAVVEKTKQFLISRTRPSLNAISILWMRRKYAYGEDRTRTIYSDCHLSFWAFDRQRRRYLGIDYEYHQNGGVAILEGPNGTMVLSADIDPQELHRLHCDFASLPDESQKKD